MGTAATLRLSRNQLNRINLALTERHRDVLRLLAVFQTATTAQLQRVVFADRASVIGQAQAAKKVLRRLRETGLIDHLPRRVGGITGGSTPGVWFLTPGGWRLSAVPSPGSGWFGLQLSTPLPTRPHVRPGQPPALFTLNHRLAVVETFVQLHESWQAGRLDLLSFTPEPGCWRSFLGRYGAAETLKPDGFARTAATGSQFERLWFVEIDMGSESLSAVSRKTAVYEAYRRTGIEQASQRTFPRVAWIAPDQTRADRLNQLFTHDSSLDADSHAALTLERFITGNRTPVTPSNTS